MQNQLLRSKKMCTVTFYQNNNSTIITSNRDEHVQRPLALHPECYDFKGRRMYFPKDPKSGGSWFVVNKTGQILVLLNGADVKHIPSPPYRLSRGTILIQLASETDIHAGWKEIELDNIEPFTIVFYSSNQLFQFRWNGLNKTTLVLDANNYHIWSSTTLYDLEIIQQREKWFHQFMQEKMKSVQADDLIHFHTHTKNDDKENGLVINRNQSLLTKNVTQVILDKVQFKLQHFDLIQNTQTSLTDFFE